MRAHIPTEPMKQRFKKGRFWRFSPDDIHFRDDPDDIGRDIRTLGYKPHSHPRGRKPCWRKKRREIRRYRAKMKATANGLIIEGTPEEMAALLKLIETKPAPHHCQVHIELDPIFAPNPIQWKPGMPTIMKIPHNGGI
jgi:hypothetical protein